MKDHGIKKIASKQTENIKIFISKHFLFQISWEFFCNPRGLMVCAVGDHQIGAYFPLQTFRQIILKLLVFVVPAHSVHKSTFSRAYFEEYVFFIFYFTKDTSTIIEYILKLFDSLDNMNLLCWNHIWKMVVA